MTVDRPIFVVGTGRSGTTLLLDLVAFHPALAWFSTYNEVFPAVPWVSVLSRLHAVGVFDGPICRRARWFPRPTESYRMLDRCTDSRFTLRRNLEPRDALPEVQTRFRETVARQLRLQGKSRFVCKYTGLPRIGFVRAIFPDAFFVHVYRDGRAVVNSLLRVDWWSGDFGAWRYGEMKPESLEEYRRSGEQAVVLAGIAWKTLMDSIEEEAAELDPSRLFRLRYDELVRSPREALERLCRACEIEPDLRFLERASRFPVSNMDEKWKRQLNEPDLRRLETSIGGHLERYGFTS